MRTDTLVSLTRKLNEVQHSEIHVIFPRGSHRRL